MDDSQLRTVWQQRQFSDRAGHLSHPLALLMKYDLSRRVRDIGRLAKVWDEVVPPEINEHTALESFNRGVLTVLVDSASHRFQLNAILEGGLRREIQQQFPGTLNKIRLQPGNFSAVELQVS